MNSRNLVFTQPTVITIKKDHSVETALNARALIQTIDKDKYQMQTLETLLEMVAEKVYNENREAWYSLKDITYAYSEVTLQLQTAEHFHSK